jgi:nitroreductase
MSLQDICLARQTLKTFNGRPLTASQIETYLLAAVHAPNHRLSEPWRFYVYLNKALEAFLKRFPAMEKLQKSKVGALLFVTQKLNPNPEQDREDYAAVCAAIENILLSAAAEGVASYWSTSSVFYAEDCLHYVNINPEERLVGVLWLGYPEQELKPVSRRSFAGKTHWA